MTLRAVTAYLLALLLLPGSMARAEEGANWPSYGGVNEAHYSPLRQVNDQTVKQLGLAWFYDIDTKPSAFTAPVAVDGVLYFAAGYSVVHAVEAKTGKLLWKFDPEVPKAAGKKMRAAWGSRGIAYDNSKVFTATIDGRLIALDAKTGKLLWSAMTIAADDERYISGPPWVFKGKVAIGHSGADFGPVRGYITAYDQNTGQQAWRFYTVPGDPAKGFENAAMEMAAKTWTGKWWEHGGGGTVWHALAYDPKFNRVYFGTGNGAPWSRAIRSPGGGDNLFICSIVAVDADTGAYVWHYQLDPGDEWDFDANTDIALADLKIAGQEHSVIVQAAKNGFFYVLDRATGKLLSAEKFVTANWAERIDLATGRPVEVHAARMPDGKPFAAFPSAVGGHSTDSMSFNPISGLVYIPANEQGRMYAPLAEDLSTWRHAPDQMISTGVSTLPLPASYPAATSLLLAWDPVKQKAAWSVPLKGTRNGSTMTTAGNLVFQGQIAGDFVAYAADTGKKLWSFYGQTGVVAQPVSYLVDGKQYVSVIAGSRSVSAAGLPREWNYYAQKWRVLTFALGGTAHLPTEDKTPYPVLDDPAFVIDPAKADVGKTLFAQRCANCHGAAVVSGGAAPDLRRAANPLSIEAMTDIVKNGALQQNGMPQFGELTAADIAAVQHYIRQRARATLANPS